MHIIDILIIVAFLMATLYVGFSSSKKIKTFNDYAIGNRKFSDFAIFCTVAATAIGGNATIGGVGKAYGVGVIQFLAQVGLPISFIIVATFLVRRFSTYYGCYSLGDMFYKAYGTPGKILAGIVGCVYETCITGIQFIAMGTAISVLTGFSYVISLIISGGIILIYTGRGGIKAVTFTDVLQFLVLILAIPILLVVILYKIGGISVLMDKLPQSYVRFQGENFNRYLFLMFPLMLPTLSPHHVQRLLMTKNYSQGKKAYYNLSWIYLLVAVTTILLGLSAKLLFPELPKADQALFALIINYLPVGFLGIAIIGVLAVLMSSADSDLNSGSIMLVNDVIIPYNKYVNKKELSEAEKLKFTRIISFLMGIGAIIFASQKVGIFETRILIRTMWFSIILSPLYFLLFNIKIPLKGLFISAMIGLVTCVFWNINMKPVTKIDGLFPGFFANVISVLFFYFLNGRPKVFTKKELEEKRREETLQEDKCKSIASIQAGNNVFLGLYLVCLQLMPLIFTTTKLTYMKLLLALFNGTMAIMLIFGSSLKIFENVKYLNALKLVTLFFCLPITSAYLFLTSSINGLHLVTLFLSFIVMLSSFDSKKGWKIVITCILTTLVTFFIHYILNREIHWVENFGWQHSFYLFGYFIVLFLLRSNLKLLQKEKELAIYHERYNMARNLSHDLMTPLMALSLLTSKKKLNEFNEKDCKLHKEILEEMAQYIEDFVPSSLKDHKYLKAESLNDCVLDCIEKQKILHKHITIRLQAEEVVLARVNKVLLRRVLNNLINVCIGALPKNCSTIVVAVDQDHLGNSQILLQSEIGGFSSKTIYNIFEENKRLGEELSFGVSFQEFRDIIEKWHGRLEIISHENNAILQILLPNKDQDQVQ